MSNFLAKSTLTKLDSKLTALRCEDQHFDDTTHDPHVTKEQLDRELDAYMNHRNIHSLTSSFDKLTIKVQKNKVSIHSRNVNIDIDI